MPVELYRQKPVDIEALRFDGWQTLGFENVMRWMNAAMPFYVPQGYEHHARIDTEKDRSRGDTLEGAPPYLMLDTVAGRIRVNPSDWIVKNKTGEIKVYKHSDFLKQFDSIPKEA